MIQYKNGGCRVEDLSELPDLRNARELFLDFETGSKDRISGGNKPYHGDRLVVVEEVLPPLLRPLLLRPHHRSSSQQQPRNHCFSTCN
jgi:hypothetical protein